MGLTSEHEALVKKEIAAKCRVLAAGFEKRGRREDAEAYRKLLGQYL
jgi:protein involved in ribonucleotide reduction